MDYSKESLALHKRYQGKIRVTPKVEVRTTKDLSLVYSPGVAAPCLEIAKDESKVWDYTIKGNTVAIVSDGTAVLGLGDIGPKASIPVMEGKAMLFKKFAGIDAFPICLDTKDVDKIVETVKLISPVFGGVNLVVINGAGAAGIAIAKLLRCIEHEDNVACIPVKDIIICDSKGIVSADREDLNSAKRAMLPLQRSCPMRL